MNRFIVTELCIGTLEDYISNKCECPKTLSEWEILHQVTQGLAHLHDLDIVHRDIKPTNILIFVSSAEIDKPKMKLADFGLSKVLKFGKEDFTNTNMEHPNGTKGWLAPEVYELDRYNFKVDIWALGCIFGYTLSIGNKHPFGDDCNERIVRIRRKEPMLMVKEDLKTPYCNRDGATFKLIQTMLEVEPSKRPTITDLFEKSAFFIFNAVIWFISLLLLVLL